MTTKIAWTDQTWNPVTGCSKVSAGCKHCYAERIFHRPYPGRPFTDVLCHPERLDAPLHWRKPRRVFVNSMSDLFHEDVPDTFIDQVFAAMQLAWMHTFQILTKRPERMLKYMRGVPIRATSVRVPLVVDLHDPVAALGVLRADWDNRRWPPRNVWLGVSVEDQQSADERLPLLLDAPSAVRFVSAEPLLAPVTMRLRYPITGPGSSLPASPPSWSVIEALSGYRGYEDHKGLGAGEIGSKLDWVIVGGDSGPKARPCDIAWIRSIIAQCRDASAPCFVKQLGSNVTGARRPSRAGADPAEWPEDVRVREFPE